jgi:hypothetical protein
MCLTTHRAMEVCGEVDLMLRSYFDVDLIWNWLVRLVLRPHFRWRKEPGQVQCRNPEVCLNGGRLVLHNSC